LSEALRCLRQRGRGGNGALWCLLLLVQRERRLLRCGSPWERLRV